MSEIGRLYAYKTLLSGRHAVPRSEILSKMEISLATFKRDLARLRNYLNTPIVFDRDLRDYQRDGAKARQELWGLWFRQERF